VAQRSVEVVVGRLATDERFRAAFRRDPLGTLGRLVPPEVVLTPTERDALAATPPAAWDTIAAALDTRLQKIALPEDDPLG
jgi:hypothetical protein